MSRPCDTFMDRDILLFNKKDIIYNFNAVIFLITSWGIYCANFCALV